MSFLPLSPTWAGNFFATLRIRPRFYCKYGNAPNWILINSPSKFFSGSFLCPFFQVFAFLRILASILDVARTRHSGRHTQPRQHPTHEHEVTREERDEPKPLTHSSTL